ncbi:hypothetical protein ECEC4402_5824, partial [Escherichia coli EC4402]
MWFTLHKFTCFVINNIF